MTKIGRRFSPWWIVGIAVLSVILLGAGGGLINEFDACILDGYICYTAPYNAGIALISLGSLCSFAWVILLIVWLVSRRGRPQWTNNGSRDMPGNVAAQVPQQDYPLQTQHQDPIASAKEPYTSVTAVEQPAMQQQQPAMQQQIPVQQQPTPMKEPSVSAQPIPQPMTPQQQQQPQPLQSTVPYPLAAHELQSPDLPPAPQYSNDTFCGQCGSAVHSPFCPRCGAAVATA